MLLEGYKYPENELKALGASCIGSNVFNGVYWFIFTKDNKLENFLIKINQEIARLKELQNRIINVIRRDNCSIVIIEREVYAHIANELIEEAHEKFPEIPKLKSKLDLNKLREKEIQTFVSYILQLKKQRADIFLFKTSGERVKTILVYDTQKDKTDLYKKRIYGFYLTEHDIEDANKLLGPHDKKISTIEPHEMFNNEYGIRYTIEITRADKLN